LRLIVRPYTATGDRPDPALTQLVDPLGSSTTPKSVDASGKPC
jgi:hypothetical protein